MFRARGLSDKVVNSASLNTLSVSTVKDLFNERLPFQQGNFFFFFKSESTLLAAPNLVNQILSDSEQSCIVTA